MLPEAEQARPRLRALTPAQLQAKIVVPTLRQTLAKYHVDISDELLQYATLQIQDFIAG
jgi:hypothetical protein